MIKIYQSYHKLNVVLDYSEDFDKDLSHDDLRYFVPYILFAVYLSLPFTLRSLSFRTSDRK